MTRMLCACLVPLLLAGPVRADAAESARLRHLASVYADENGGGLKLPEGVACGADGQIIVGDTANDRLIRFTYGDKGASAGTEMRISQLSAPARVHLNSKGDIFALDSTHRRIVHLGAGGEYKSAVTFDGIPAPLTVIPKAFAIDSADNIYVLDVFAGRVLVLNSEAQFQRALPLPAEAKFVSELSVDFAGTVLLLDSLAPRMFAAAKDATAFAPFGGNLTDVLPTLPTYLTASKGAIFVAEGQGGSIVAFGRDGSFLARQLTMGWIDGSLNHPSQICINAKDEMFVADRDNSRIQVFQLVR